MRDPGVLDCVCEPKTRNKARNIARNKDYLRRYILIRTYYGASK